MNQVANAARITAVGTFYVGVFTVVVGFASQWNPVVIWSMAAVASVVTLAGQSVSLYSKATDGGCDEIAVSTDDSLADA